MKVVIIEDEKLSAEHLTVLLKKIDPFINVIEYFDTITASVTAFREGLTADLIFMDIHLADGNSFEIFNQIELEIPVVFTTAFDNYAIQAFKQNATAVIDCQHAWIELRAMAVLRGGFGLQ